MRETIILALPMIALASLIASGLACGAGPEEESVESSPEALADPTQSAPWMSRIYSVIEREREKIRNAEGREGILAEEATHVGVVDQHNALLASPRDDLSPRACELLDRLECVTADDYLHCAERSVYEVVSMMRRYSQPTRIRTEIEAGAPATV